MSAHSFSPVPAIDESFGLANLIDHHAAHNAERPFAVLAPDELCNASQITFLEFGRACQRFARSIVPHAPVGRSEVVGLIINCDTIMYVTAIAGLIRAGLTPFPISHRNSAEAVCHILHTVSAHRAIVTSASLGELLADVKSRFDEEQYVLQFDELPPLTDIYPLLGYETTADAFDPLPALPLRSVYTNDTIFYLHSSGSTGFPKSIPYSWGFIRSLSNSATAADISAHSKPLLLGLMALPAFHTMSLYTQLLMPLFTGCSIALYGPRFPHPPVIPSPENTLQALKSTGSNLACVAPTFIEVWAREPESVRVLKKLDFLAFGGGPLVPALGNMLTRVGIKLISLYGGTEFGLPLRFLTSAVGRDPEDWPYLEFSDSASPRWADQGNGSFELQLLTTNVYKLGVENLPDLPGYSTQDIFTPHPTKKGLWRITGRADDVLILASGEKVVPGPMEHIIAAHPFVQAAVMFGRERNQVGVLVAPIAGHEFDPSDEVALAVYRNEVWAAVEEANHTAPSFSRIFKEMILVTSPWKPLPRTPKGTVNRKAAILAYEHEINELYTAAENAGQIEGAESPTSWTVAEVQHWLTSAATAMNDGKSIDIEADLFQQGFDSLSATSLRNHIIHCMRTADDAEVREAVHKINNAFVYTHPSVVRLASGIIGRLGQTETGEQEGRISAMRHMIKHFAVDMPTILDTPEGTSSAPKRRTVLITGTTGSLGSQLLAMCLVDEAVERVYALNRPSSRLSIIERHMHTFSDRCLDLDLLSSEKLVYLEAKISSDWLGLERATYDTIRSTVTTIIHNAWRLDFNLTLSSFTPHVRGTRNLLDLALTSPHAHHIRFLFTSSIAVSFSWPVRRGPFPEEPVATPAVALSNGYGESKYVAEQLLIKAAERGLQTTSFRIGQITGGNTNGAWATSDWVPIFVKSSISLGCLPDAHGLASWIPVDAVAQTIMDALGTAHTPQRALNIVHPHPVPWNQIMEYFADALLQHGITVEHLPTVMFEEWYAKIQAIAGSASEVDITRIPAIKIANFLHHQAQADRIARETGDPNVEAGGFTTLATEKAQVISPSLHVLPSLNANDIRRWVRYWVNSGFLSA